MNAVLLVAVIVVGIAALLYCKVIDRREDRTLASYLIAYSRAGVLFVPDGVSFEEGKVAICNHESVEPIDNDWLGRVGYICTVCLAVLPADWRWQRGLESVMNISVTQGRTSPLTTSYWSRDCSCPECYQQRRKEWQR